MFKRMEKNEESNMVELEIIGIQFTLLRDVELNGPFLNTVKKVSHLVGDEFVENIYYIPKYRKMYFEVKEVYYKEFEKLLKSKIGLKMFESYSFGCFRIETKEVHIYFPEFEPLMSKDSKET